MAGIDRKDPCRMLKSVLVWSLLLLLLSGCAQMSNYLDYMGRHRDLTNTLHNHPRMEVLRELSPENCYSLRGRLIMDRPYEGPVLVVAVSDRYQQREIVATRIIRSPAIYYVIFLPEGEYDLYIYADLNGNGFFETTELVGRTMPGKPASVKKEKAVDAILVDGPDAKIDINHPLTSDIFINARVAVSNYKYDSLDDEFFDPRYGTMGIYRPTEFLTHTQGSLFALEDYDPDKTMVIFVHGVEGTPRDWKYLVEGLDRKRFQPWFYYYPSGLPLEKLGSLLAHAIKIFDEFPDYKLKQLVIVAHSMGGLVARSAIDSLCRESTPPYLKMYISMSSPYGGIEEAKSGLKSAPVIVPSWRDVATDSNFLKNIYERDMPDGVPFHMFFGYRNKSGASSDGTITLRSQLDSRVHLKAVKTYGFDTTHVGILNDEAVKQEFYRLLLTVDPANVRYGKVERAK